MISKPSNNAAIQHISRKLDSSITKMSPYSKAISFLETYVPLICILHFIFHIYSPLFVSAVLRRRQLYCLSFTNRFFPIYRQWTAQTQAETPLGRKEKNCRLSSQTAATRAAAAARSGASAATCRWGSSSGSGSHLPTATAKPHSEDETEIGEGKSLSLEFLIRG